MITAVYSFTNLNAMKNSLFFLLLFAVPFFTGCNSSGSAEKAPNPEEVEQKLWDEMMVIHDEVMPAMGDIFKYSKTLKTHLENTEVEPAVATEIEATIETLNQADDGMMDWMAELKQLSELRKNMEHEAIVEYLKTETDKIKSVKKQMEESLEEGEKMVRKITPVEVSE